MYLKREDLNGKSYEIVQSLLEGETVKFTEELESDLTKDQLNEVLKKAEEDVVKELNDYDKYLDEVEYELPGSCDFEGEHFTRAQVAKMIVKHICKNEVEWKFALGLYQMVTIWSEKGLKTIKYKPYDSTLRMLGQVKYKGLTDWKEILVINEYAAKIRESYAIDTAWLYYLSNKHSIILDKMKSINPEISEDVPVDGNLEIPADVPVE